MPDELKMARLTDERNSPAGVGDIGQIIWGDNQGTYQGIFFGDPPPHYSIRPRKVVSQAVPPGYHDHQALSIGEDQPLPPWRTSCHPRLARLLPNPRPWPAPIPIPPGMTAEPSSAWNSSRTHSLPACVWASEICQIRRQPLRPDLSAAGGVQVECVLGCPGSEYSHHQRSR